MLNRDGGPWEGGYISVGTNGRKTFIIERRVNGRRFHVSTRCHERRSALAQLDRFERNPLAYRPEGDDADAPLHITAADLQRYIVWTRERKGNTRQHAVEVKRYLGHWLEDIGAADWRHLKLPRLKQILDARKSARPNRIAAIKGFCRWLRQEEAWLTSAQDVTRDLASIQATPEKQRREKKVPKVVVEQLLAARAPDGSRLLDERTWCFLVVKASTGLHHSEILRIVRGENATIEVLDERAAARSGCPAVVRFIHKNGDNVVKRIDTAGVLDALRSLQASGVTMRSVNKALKAACVDLGFEAFTAGVLRHSWGTWHVENGASIEAVAAGYGHQSKRTTERFYVQVAVPHATLPPVTFDAVDQTVH